MKEAMYYSRESDGKIRCELCFHECILDNGELGFCMARRNLGGRLVAETYAAVVSGHLDPIEKKPLYHFHPGSSIFSVAANGCNLACPFCQNIEISRKRTRFEEIPPKKLVELAKKTASRGIAYTYTEPLIWYEYLLDTAQQAHKEELYNVIVSNGTINEAPLRKLLPYIDAANIDLKGDAEFYKKVLKGDRESVIRTIVMLHQAGVHIEITNLIIPDVNDSAEAFNEVISFIEGLEPTIPLHISRYFPHASFSAPPTPVKTMLAAYEQAKSRLPYVYLGNIMLPTGQNTYCPECSTLLVERTGYGILLKNIKENSCENCGRKLDLIL